MENNKKFLTIIVILSVLLVGSLGYITYDKLSNKKDNTNEVKNDNKDNNTKELTVSNVYNYHGIMESTCPQPEEDIKEGKKIYNSVDITLPKIDSDKPNAKKLNEKILDDYKDIIEISKQQKGKPYIDIYYKYDIKNDYLYILIYKEIGSYCSSGGDKVANYFYDIKNDKILTYEEALTALGYTEEDLFKATSGGSDMTEDEKRKSSTFESCSTNSCGCGLKLNNGKFEIYNELFCTN